ncbi:hypothetical protein DFH07DRAFT_843493 [Mycena maculata]|uniref:F-box domain-containing protein n=1 Tax=Mycena maculata TaxID=230809 RepID=A0AAD7MWF0_9AGAR|nr:hypothetical protein DFH07DRAFT_843493 [Mycena maculata]
MSGLKFRAGIKALLSRGATMVHPNRSRKTRKVDHHLIWRTNAPLSEAEATQVINLLFQAEANLRVAKLDEDHALFSAQIQSYKIALAPHKILPPEVLAIIFVNCVETPIILPPSPHEPALALAGTCRYWRNMILNIPNLWSNIFLDFSYNPHPEKLLQFAKLWLSRSETLITLRNSSSRWSESRMQKMNVDPIVDLVAPFVHRCREIDMRFLEASIDEFFTFPAGSIERLEVLYLETLGFSMPFGNASGEPLEVFRSAPRLRRVLFSTDLCSIDPNVLGLPWGQLTGLHFIATYIPPLAMHAILRDSHSLLECSFSIIRLDDGLAAALHRLPECVLPGLRSLMVEFSPQTIDYAPFLRPLVLPALQDLELRPLETGALPQCPWSQRAYAGLLARSGFTLRRLAILNYMIAPRDLDTILRGMPSLTDFHLFLWETTPWDAGVLHALAEGALLPRLEELTFSTYPLADVLATLEARVAHGGTGGVARLRALNMAVTWWDDVPADAFARFMHLAEGSGPACRAFTHTRAYAHDRASTQICAS